MISTRLLARRVPSRPLNGVSRALILPVPKANRSVLSKRLLVGLIFSLITFWSFQTESRADLVYPEEEDLATQCAVLMDLISWQQGKVIDLDHFESLGPDADFPEPAANLKRLEDEILSLEPEEILKTISGNSGAGCNVYVIDRGHLHRDMKSKLVFNEQQISDFGQQPKNSHANEVLSLIIGKDGLAKDARIYYFGTCNAIGPSMALLKTAYIAKAPGVVTCSVAVHTASDYRTRRIEPVLRLISSIAIALITAKGIPVIVASNNEGSSMCPKFSLPVSCERVWAVGNVGRTESGPWAVHPFSDRGDWIKFYAPGTHVQVQTYDKDEDGYVSGIMKGSGTSYSTAELAGTIALLLTAYPWMRKADVEIALDHISIVETDIDGRSYRRVPTEKIREIK